MSRTRILIIPAALAMLAAGPLSIGAAQADNDQHVRDQHGRAPARHQAMAGATVDAAGAIAAVRSAGYAAIRDLEWDDGAWKIEATDAQGQKVKLRVDASSGAVTRKGI